MNPTQTFLATVARHGGTVTTDRQHGTFGEALKVRVTIGDTFIGQANFDAMTGEELGYWSRTGTWTSREVSRASFVARIRRTSAAVNRPPAHA